MSEKHERQDDELRRELAEVHAVATRTHNAVATVAASLKEVVALRQRYERGLNLNSFVAYVLFTVLLGGAFYLLYRSRAGRLVEDRDAAIARRDQAIQEQRRDRETLAKREDAARQARDFHQLLVDGKRAEAIRRYHEVKGLPLSEVERAVFEQGVQRARAEIVDDAYAQGLEAFRADQWKRASAELKVALAYQSEGPDAIKMRYYYGVALHKQGDYAEASKQLETAIAGGVERTVGVDARFYLASALEMLRQLDRARTEYVKFADGHPGHLLGNTARRKAVELGQRLARTN